MKDLEKTIQGLIELAKKDRKALSSLKAIAVNAQNYELAASIREYEVEQYPKCKSTDPEYKEAEAFKKLCSLGDVTIPSNQMAYKLLAFARLWIEKKDNSDLMSVSKISSEAKEIFGE